MSPHAKDPLQQQSIDLLPSSEEIQGQGASDCQELREDYLFGMLAPEEEAAYLVHAEACETCQEALAHHARLDQCLQPLALPPLSPPQVTAQEHQRLLAHVGQQVTSGTTTPLDETFWERLQRLIFGDVQTGRSAWLWPLAAATCLALLVLPQSRITQERKHTRTSQQMTARTKPSSQHQNTPRQRHTQRPQHRALARLTAPRKQHTANVVHIDMSAFIALPEDQPGARAKTVRAGHSSKAAKPGLLNKTKAAPRAIARVALPSQAKNGLDAPMPPAATRGQDDRVEDDFPEDATIQARPDGTLQKSKPLPTLAALSGRSRGLRQFIAEAPSAGQRAVAPRPFRSAVIGLD